MCDQDHFEKDRQEYEALGLVTRRQFGIMLGAGMAMMLPQVANAVTVTESDVKVMTPDGTADCYFVHPASGTAAGILVWPAMVGCQERKDGDPRLLHGRPDCVSHGGRSARSRRRRRLVPWWRTCDRHAEQSASSGREDQGAAPHRDRGKRRHAVAQ